MKSFLELDGLIYILIPANDGGSGLKSLGVEAKLPLLLAISGLSAASLGSQREKITSTQVATEAVATALLKLRYNNDIYAGFQEVN